MKTISFAEFEQTYLPQLNQVVENPEEACPLEGTMYETSGAEYAHVAAQPAAHVWTLVDADGKSYLVPGFHLVNRQGYLITAKPHDFEVQVEVYEDEIECPECGSYFFANDPEDKTEVCGDCLG